MVELLPELCRAAAAAALAAQVAVLSVPAEAAVPSRAPAWALAMASAEAAAPATASAPAVLLLPASAVFLQVVVLDVRGSASAEAAAVPVAHTSGPLVDCLQRCLGA